MPTATSLSGLSLINIGPLTTTFTAPASCSTAYRTLIAPATDPALYQWNVHCPWLPPVDCNPSGTVVQALVSSGGSPNPSARMFIPYNSPGLICPSGWATVGGAAKPNPTSLSISGAFNQSIAVPTGSEFVFVEPQLDIFLAALDPGETAILCCPSSYIATNGGCYSTLPRSVFAPTSGCGDVVPSGDVGTVSGTWTIGQQTITGGMLTITATTPVSSVATSFSPAEATSYVGVAVEGMYILVHQSSDTATASAPASTTKKNSGARVRGGGNRLRVVAALCCLSFVLEVFLAA